MELAAAVPLRAGPITLGCATAIVTSFIQSLGLTLQRKSHVREESRPPHARRRPFRRPLWRLGLAIFLLSNILGSTVQITTLPLVILAPLQASGLIFNAILAALILKEKFTRWSLIGTVLVSLGAGIIAGFGALDEPSHTLTELLAMFSRTGFVIWISLQFALVVASLIVSTFILNSIRKRSRIIDDAGLGFVAISQLAVGRTLRILKTVRGCILGCLSGLLSAHCLLLAKTGVELVIRTIVDHKNQFGKWQAWMILIVLGVLELAQLYYLNSGLRLCSTTILYPLVFCIYNIISILDGLIYYQQASRLTVLQMCLVASGTVILLLGVLSLSWRLGSETSVIPTAPLTADPFATVPAYELFSDEDESGPCGDNSDEEIAEERGFVKAFRKRVSTGLSYVEVEVLKDVLSVEDGIRNFSEDGIRNFSDDKGKDAEIDQVSVEENNSTNERAPLIKFEDNDRVYNQQQRIVLSNPPNRRPHIDYGTTNSNPGSGVEETINRNGE